LQPEKASALFLAVFACLCVKRPEICMNSKFQGLIGGFLGGIILLIENCTTLEQRQEEE